MTTIKKLNYAPAVLVVAALILGACDSRGGSALLGGAAGAAAGAGGYELHLNKQKNIVEESFNEGRIDRREYEIRLDQIRRDSLVQ